MSAVALGLNTIFIQLYAFCKIMGSGLPKNQNSYVINPEVIKENNLEIKTQCPLRKTITEIDMVLEFGLRLHRSIRRN